MRNFSRKRDFLLTRDNDLILGRRHVAEREREREETSVHWKLQNCEYTIIKGRFASFVYLYFNKNSNLVCNVYDRCENLSGFQMM